jgi:hypothetical protein
VDGLPAEEETPAAAAPASQDQGQGWLTGGGGLWVDLSASQARPTPHPSPPITRCHRITPATHCLPTRSLPPAPPAAAGAGI